MPGTNSGNPPDNPPNNTDTSQDQSGQDQSQDSSSQQDPPKDGPLGPDGPPSGTQQPDQQQQKQQDPPDKCSSYVKTGEGLAATAAMNEAGAFFTGEVSPAAAIFHGIAILEGLGSAGLIVYGDVFCK
jgi:hypothetical protein